MKSILSGISYLASYLSFIFLRRSSFSLSVLIGGGFGNGVRFSANLSSSFLRACSLGAPKGFSIQFQNLSSTLSKLTGCVSFDVSHFDQAIGCFLNIIIAIGEYIQKQVFLNGGKNTLEVSKIQKLISVYFCFDTFQTNRCC